MTPAYDFRAPELPGAALRPRPPMDVRDVDATHHATAPIVCIARRVDHLRLAFAVELFPDVLRLLKHRGALAEKHGKASIEVGAFVAELGPSSKPDRWDWKSKHSHGRIDLKAPGGWTVEITIHGAQWLENPDVEAQLAWCLTIARLLGRVCDERADKGARLRRFDLCADFENLSIEDLERDSFVMPKGVHRKGSLGRYTPEFMEEETARNDVGPRGGGRRALRRRRDSGDIPATVRYENVMQVTGHTVCAGNAIMGKLYAKSVELLMPQRAMKADVERLRWAAGGWKGGHVTRVEFQIRSEALDEFRLRDPWDVLTKLDAVWQYLTQRWVRMVEERRPGTRTRDCKIDPRWQAVTSARFYGDAGPIERMRRRGGATEDQALGAMLSCLAGNGALAKLAKGPLLEALTEHATGAEQAGYITSVVLDTCLTFGMQLVGHLLAAPKRTRILTDAGEWLDKESHAEAIEVLSTKIDAKYARFHQGAQHDENATVQYWHATGDGEGGLFLSLKTSRPGARVSTAGPTIDAAPS